MIPVDQTRLMGTLQEPPGNCWAACVASILELPLSEVPDEVDDWEPGMDPRKSWVPYQKRIHQWLFDRGLVLIEVQAKHLNYCGPLEIFKSTHCILSGPSPRNPEVQHAVVGLGNTIAHDPHPSRDGLVGDGNEWWYEFFVRAK